MTQTRAERRRAERERKKAAERGELKDQRISLVNPVSEQFDTHIVGNAQYADRVCEPYVGRGKTLVIAGAGPSLADHAGDYCEQADEVWGCNSAAIWLHDNGHKVTHAFTVDQTAHMVEEWYSAPDIEYLVASTVHPHLVEYLRERERRIRFFHNFVGIKKPPVILCQCGHGEQEHRGPCLQCECDEYDEVTMPYEEWLYSLLYESTCVVGAGLNATTRAIDLAGFMGFEKIQVIGADCAIRIKSQKPQAPFGSPEHLKWLREETVMHADGGSALASEATPVTLDGYIDGRHWETKPDLVISAVWLVRMSRVIPQVELIGDTLPNALIDKDDDFLDELPHLTDSDGKAIRFEVATRDYNFDENAPQKKTLAPRV
jgi:hypothetical protein